MKTRYKIEDITKEIESNYKELPLIFQELEFKPVKAQKNSERKIVSSYYGTRKLDIVHFYKPILRIEK